jgi:hypothetical protein
MKLAFSFQLFIAVDPPAWLLWVRGNRPAGRASKSGGLVVPSKPAHYMVIGEDGITA